MEAKESYVGMRKRRRPVRYRSRGPVRKAKSVRTVIARPLRGGLPPRLRTSLVYVGNPAITTVSSYVSSWVFKGNALYDPDDTGSGHQPRGYDQIMPLYTKYWVNASKIYVDFVTYTTAVGGETLCAVYPEDVSPTPASYTDLLERNDVKWAMTTVSGGGKMCSVVNSTTTKLQFGDIDYSNQEGTQTTDPTDKWYWVVGISTINGTTTATGQAYVRIEYDVYFSEPRLPAQS